MKVGIKKKGTRIGYPFVVVIGFNGPVRTSSCLANFNGFETRPYLPASFRLIASRVIRSATF